jgi:hypothetical protein
MEFTELEEHARKIANEQIEPTLRQLMMDPRFPVVLRIVQDHRSALVQTASAPATAAHASSGPIMAHALGGVDALIAIEARLHGALDQSS